MLSTAVPNEPGQFPTADRTDPWSDIVDKLPPWPMALLLLLIFVGYYSFLNSRRRQREHEAQIANERAGRLPDVWSVRDDALLVTVSAARALRTDGQVNLPARTAPFAPSIAPGEQLWVAGAARVLQWTAPGDGTYEKRSGGLYVLSPAWLAVMPMVSAGRALGNRQRRRQAEADLVERWVPVGTGTAWIGSHGFYVDGDVLLEYGWDSVQSVQLVGPGAVMVKFTAADRTSRVFILETQWAELLFVLWAAARTPQDPALDGFGWLPSGWLDKAEAWASGRVAISR